MKKLINAPNNVVSDAIAGVISLGDKLDVLPGSTTVVRRDYNELAKSGKVALISGGGSGHEPAHAGYVGPGLLTAAVCGEVFTSPSTDAVLQAIKAVSGEAGVLLLIKNYTGDVLNFRLAAQLAQAEGIQVESVIIRDDVALLDVHDNEARRGLAGTVFVHKVAGAAAEAGLSLPEVARVAQKAADGLATMGVGLGPCTVPAAGKPNFELDEDEIEWGLGIHGEPGTKRAKIVPASEIAETLITTITRHSNFGGDSEFALLVNGMGGTPQIELDIIAAEALKFSSRIGLKIKLAWCGNYLTALEMPGCSISLLALDSEVEQLLLESASSSAWRAASRVSSGNLDALNTRNHLDDSSPHQETAASPVSGNGTIIANVIKNACDAIIASEEKLTELDQSVGDGDLGISLSRGCNATLKQISSFSSIAASDIFAQLSLIFRSEIGGTSGPLYASFFLGISSELEEHGDTDISAWARAFSRGVKNLMDLGGAKRGDKTMLDALIPAAETFEKATDDDADLLQALSNACDAAEEGTKSTEEIVAGKGRARYLAERAKGHPDPGAVAVTIWLRAVESSIKSLSS